MIALVGFNVAALVVGPLYISSRSNTGFAQTSDLEPKEAAKPREVLMIKRLRQLLADDNVVVHEANIVTSRAAAKAIRLRWSSSDARGNSNLSDVRPSVSSVSVESVQDTLMARPRQRSLELSPTLIMLAGVDDKNQLVWWDVVPDPQLVRAESANEKGELSGRVLYRSEAEVLFSLPAYLPITEIRLYRPEWDGTDYKLERFANINLPADWRQK